MPKIVRVILIAVLLTATAVSQQRAPAATARIDGTIMDAASGRGLVGVAVRAGQGTSRRETATDAQGHFTLDVSAGTIQLLGAKEGFADLRVTGHQIPGDSGIWFTLSAGQQIKGLTFRMSPSGAIAGRILDAKGKPVVNARPQILRETYDENGSRTLRPAKALGGATNDRGEFRLSGINPGTYLLYIRPPLLNTSSTGDPFLPVYYPGTSDEFPATPVEIKGGPDTRLDDLKQPSDRGGTIRVHLINQTGILPDTQLQKWIHWQLQGTQGESVMVHPLLLGGMDRAEIPVTPGTYDIAVGWTTNRGEPIGIGQTTVQVARSDVSLDLTVPKGVKVSGRSLIEQTAGAARPTTLHCDIKTSAPGIAASVPTMNLTSSPDGTMSANNVPPAIYRVECPSLPPDAYLTEIRQGDRDVLKDGLQVGSSDIEFVITIKTPGGAVQGTVTNSKGEKVQGAIVAIVPDAPAREAKYLYQTDVTDQKGAFSIRGVAPGAYHLFAWSELDGAAYKNAEFMKKFDSQGSAVKVDRGGKLVVDLKILDQSN